MNIYLVGGAVRDELLNCVVKERDWVVVGGTAAELISQGYKPVGRDFPVFLHPKTREEYALARKEKKVGVGYYGFDCDSSTQVTLEEDLGRRDLTINAMAKDAQGNLIDPYKGLVDLEHKRLRHVSPAFSEDPVRVLRIARFAARYYHLGFTVAEETRQLMYQMAKNNELNHLVAERVWQEWEKSLTEPNPEQFIVVLRACGALKIILPELDRLFGVPNKPHYHPEIDSGIHTLLVLASATQSTSDAKIRFAALTHDLGKALTPITVWPGHPDHEAQGVLVINELCARLKIPNVYREIAVLSSRFHLLIHQLNALDATTIVSVLERCDAFRRPNQFLNLLIVCDADANGCGRQVEYTQAARWRYLLQQTKQITAAHLVDSYKGAEIRTKLHQLRVERVECLMNHWNNYD